MQPMSEYRVKTPDFIKVDFAIIYANIWDYSQRAADNFERYYREKLEQIEKYPFSCAVDVVYPSLIEKQIRKAVIYDGRYLLLYMVKDKDVVPLMVERAERDYITTFEANLRLYEDEQQRDG
jgi:hypothetical protein